jgi:hypothetical protein
MSMGLPVIIPDSLRASVEGEWPEGVKIYKDENECIGMIKKYFKNFLLITDI